MDKQRAIEAIQMAQRDVDNPSSFFVAGDMTPEAISGRLDKARIDAEIQRMFVEDGLAIAREKLQALRSSPAGADPVE